MIIIYIKFFFNKFKVLLKSTKINIPNQSNWNWIGRIKHNSIFCCNHLTTELLALINSYYEKRKSR
jgi:hypothetical protein